jgi:hypothetical protein
MDPCADESRTLHHRGEWFGFGPVRPSEQIIFAVFAGTNRNAAGRLSEDSFSNQKLIKTNESVARSSFITRAIFDKKIGKNNSSGKGAVVGVAYVDVSRIHQLSAEIADNNSTYKVRAVCVIDRVEHGDCQGHAAMGYGEATTLVSDPKKMGKLRKRIRLDLANQFSDVITVEKYHWAKCFDLFGGRFDTVLRALLQRFLARHSG